MLFLSAFYWSFGVSVFALRTPQEKQHCIQLANVKMTQNGY